MKNQTTMIRSLGFGYVVIFVIANIIGSGVFKKIAPMTAELNSSAWVLLAWLAAGIITLFGALSNAEIAGMLADTGGEFVYFKKIYNRFFAFIYGWSLFAVIQTATISSLAYVFAQSLNSILPIPTVFESLQDYSIGGVFFPFQDFQVKLVAILLIVLLTILNISGLKGSASTGKWLFWLTMAGLIFIVVFGLMHVKSLPENFMNPADFTRVKVSPTSFFTAMLGAFWAYQGWISVGYIGGEIQNPNKNLPKGIIVGVFVVIGIYMLVNLTYLALLSVPELSSIHGSENKIAAIEAVRSFWGQTGVLFISILILFSTLGCTHASILTGARPQYAMAGDGLFFKSFARLNKAGVPGISLLWQGIWAAVLVLSGTFDQLTDMTVFAVFIFYGASALGVFILRYRIPDAIRPYKAWGYPYIPAFYVLFCVVLIASTLYSQPREAIIGLVLIFLGIPVYFLKHLIFKHK